MIKNIVIVGGGTAGWSTAAILSSNKELSITVIDPSAIPIIGVGESTIPHIHLAHKVMDFDILKGQQWLDRVDGTVKLTIEFADFNKLGEKWIHPFFDQSGADNLVFKQIMRFGYPDTSTSSQQEFIEKHTAYGLLRTKGFIDSSRWFQRSDSKTSAAYHINAVKYAELLKQETLKRFNVKYVDKIVKSTDIDIQGNISALVMDDDSKINADLVVDCTGFSAHISNKVNSTWKSAADRLFVDGALTVQLPYINRSLQLRNTTYCHALSSGWVFNIPLQSRIGTGYIFSSYHQSKESATLEFINHLKNTYGYNESDIQPKWIPFKTGYRPTPWTKNVVAIGLSAMFCEPLESTAIAVAHSGAISLKSALEDQHIPIDTLRNNFNTTCVDRAESILSFVELHYTLTKRNDSAFWSDYAKLGPSAEQKELIDCYKQTHISRENFDVKLQKFSSTKGKLFAHPSYACLFAGYDIHQYRI